jgi:hypothetical protein
MQLVTAAVVRDQEQAGCRWAAADEPVHDHETHDPRSDAAFPNLCMINRWKAAAQAPHPRIPA